MNALRRIALLAAFAAFPLAAHAQSAVPAVDLDRGIPAGASSAPRDLTVVGDRLFFTADEAGSGRELWVSDGTAAGTEMLADLCPGACSSSLVLRGALGELLFFTDESSRLWRTDGTRAGTFALPAHTEALAFLARAAFFPVCDNSGCQLWKTDGTVDRTRLVGDLDDGRTDSDTRFQGFVAGRRMFWARSSRYWTEGVWVIDGDAAEIKVLPVPATARLFDLAAGRLFFLGRQDQGEELWTSDGTAAGTRPLTRFISPAPFAASAALKAGASGIYFAADDGVHGVEAWRSNGTETGTVRVTALAPDQPFVPQLDPAQIEEAGGRTVVITFDAALGYRLFASKGTFASTVSLGPMAVSPSTGLLRAGGRIYFRADDGIHGYELWSTDGRPAGTAMVRDICPGPCDSQLTLPQALGNGVVFLASDLVHGPQVWTSDGTAAGTRARTSLPPGALFALRFEVAALGQRLFFPAVDGHGEELWTAGPGAGNSQLVADIAGTGSSSSPRDLTLVGGRLLFTACDGLSHGIWMYGEAPGTTIPLIHTSAPGGCGSGPPEGSLPWQLTSDGTTAFLWGFMDGMPWLWQTEGTPPQKVRRVAGFSDRSPGRGMLVHAGRAYFVLHHDEAGELWVSDGTAPGTRRLAALPDRLGDSEIHMTWFGGSLYVALPHLWVGIPGGLYRSDGISADLVPLSTTLDFRETPRFTELGGRLFFLASRDGSPLWLWRSDGTAAGTVPISNESQGRVHDVLEHEGRLYYLADQYSPSGRALFRSDGTPEGTVEVARFPEVYDDPPSDLAVAAGRLFFSLDDGVHGRELWTSDGTAGGTVLVRDLYPGATSSSPSGLTAFAGKLYFTASDSVHGRELWVSDGSAAGTRLVQDIAPQGLSSAPDELTAAGENLFFSADDGIIGRELWVLPGNGTGCRAAADRLCLGNGRFAVTVAWRDFTGNNGSGQVIPLTADTGGFWFFTPENLELAVKVLDGRGLNNAFWVFYGALSNVEYEITVTDTQTGLTRRYQNPPGQLASVGDTRGFGPLGAYSVSPLPGLEATGPARAAAAGTCAPGPQRLCLNDGRFAVEAAWKDGAGNTGSGTAVPLTGDTGTFWFFGPTNLEVFTKVIDGRPLNGKFWFFYGALSDLDYTLTVTDTQTGAVRVYHNPVGRLASVADTGAF